MNAYALCANLCFMAGGLLLFIGTLISTLHQMGVLR